MIEDANLVIGTSNRGKSREFARLFRDRPWRLKSLADFPEIPASPEDGASLKENSRRKAAYLAARLRQWVLADDTGLQVEALDGAPGVQTARFAGLDATAAENRERLLRELDGVAWPRRGARFVCHLTLADPNGAIQAETVGVCRGRIRFESAGDEGFGYDGLLEILEYHRTLAELGDRVAACISHRGRAARAMTPYLARERRSNGLSVGRGRRPAAQGGK